MKTPVQLTEAQRSAAIDRVGENLALRSGAGCGKTLVLARRYVQRLLMAAEQQENPLSRLVAITFTEKAAVEMQQRVRALIAEMAADCDEPQQQRRLLEWRAQLSEARISTIHSFCASLLRGRAVEAGIDPDFAVAADEPVVQSLVAEAAEQALLEALEAGRADAADLLADVTFEEAHRQMRQLLNARTTCEFASYREPQRTLARWQSAQKQQATRAWADLEADTMVASQLRELASRSCDNKGDKLLPVRDKFVQLARALVEKPSARTPETFTQLAALKPGGFGSDRAWGGRGAAKAVRDRIRDLSATLLQCALYVEPFGDLDRRAAERLAALSHLAERAAEIYAERKRRAGVLDFDDLLLQARQLLAGDKAVRGSVVGQVDQFLIDECQDTDSLQISLIEDLVRSQDAPSRPAPGKLFLVGDDKQSIYRFRGAQVEAFRDVCRRLGRRHNQVLDVSFRMHEAGTAFVNHLFRTLMGEAYVPIRAQRSQRPPAASVEFLLASGPQGRPIASAAEATATQAALTAQQIRQMLQERRRCVWDAAAEEWRAVRPGDIAILFARMTHSLDYERELAREGIPYYVVAGTGFFRQQEVYDVLNALRVIDNPFDDVALFGALRSSLFGLDDNALMHIACACRPPYLPALNRADLSAKLPEPQQAALVAAVGLFRKLHRRKDAVRIDAVIDELLDATGYEAVLLCRGLRPAGNVRLLTDRARAAAAEGMSLSEFITQSEELILNESRYEQAAVAGEGQDVVRLMTIHKAKGLEFPVVFVPDLNAGRRGVTGPLLNRTDMGLTYRLRSDDDEPQAQLPLSYRLAEQREQLDRRAEDIRKLYVAATRHQDHLVFVGANWRNSQGEYLPSGSYLAEMDRALGLAQALDEGRETIAYGNGFEAAVRLVCPGAGKARRRGRASAGRKALAAAAGPADLAERIGKLTKPGPPPALLGPLPSGAQQVEVAVTALCDFDHCPMLYRWAHELRVPTETLGVGRVGEAVGGWIDPATKGTLVHRCMERLDFARPQGSLALVAQAAAEMNLEKDLDTAALAAELDGMIERFSQAPLWAEIAQAARTLRELDFVMACGPAVLRGQIDMLYQAANGPWRVVDYKSDRVDVDEAAAHAERYRLQMLAYSIAAARQVAQPAAEARIYFLRPGVTVTVATEKEQIESAESRIAETAERLIAARRTGQFEKRADKRCAGCPYADLCGDQPTEGTP